MKHSRRFLVAAAVCLTLGCGGAGRSETFCRRVSLLAKPPTCRSMILSASSSTRDLTGLTGTITIDGSSTLYPVSEAVAEEFQKATRNKVHVTVGHGGTGSGFKKFGRGEIEICDASRPILQAEMDVVAAAKIEYIEIPVCFDALTVAVHPSNKLTSITVAELKKMWEPESQGKVSRWNQVNPAWPDAELTLYGAGSDSGTSRLFHRSDRGKSEIEPRRLHSELRRQCSRPGNRRQQKCPGIHPLLLLSREHR